MKRQSSVRGRNDLDRGLGVIRGGYSSQQHAMKTWLVGGGPKYRLYLLISLDFVKTNDKSSSRGKNSPKLRTPPIGLQLPSQLATPTFIRSPVLLLQQYLGWSLRNATPRGFFEAPGEIRATGSPTYLDTDAEGGHDYIYPSAVRGLRYENIAVFGRFHKQRRYTK